MSGEPVVALGNAPEVVRLVNAVPQVTSVLGSECVLVGGLAVVANLLQVHRVTADLDFVTGDLPAVELLVGSGVAEPDPRRADRVVVDGTRVDLIPTVPVDDIGGLDPADQLFLLSHRWAEETGRWCRIEVVGASMSARVRIATPAALVAMKTGSLTGRRTSEQHKQASDAYDLYRLLDRLDADGAIREAFAAALPGLAGLVADRARHLLVDDPEDTVRILRRGGDDAFREIDDDDLRRVGVPFVEGVMPSSAR